MNPERQPEKLVTVGLVTWNSEQDLPSSIEGLRVQSYPRLEIVVVDNASSDSSLALIREAFPEAITLQNENNRGYCAAHNQAIRASRGEYYLALNPDVRMLPGFIDHLVGALDAHPDCGSAVGKFWQVVESKLKMLDGAGLFMDRRRHQYLRGHGEFDRGQYDLPEEVFGADGAAPLLRREMLEDLSIEGEYYDENFFVYKEDVDLAWRAKLFGWRCWYEPRAIALHDRSFRPGLRQPMPESIRRVAVKNRYLMILKNTSKAGWRRDWWRILWYDVKILGYMLLFEQTSLGAIPILLKQRHGALAWRREIRRRARAAPEEQLAWFE